MNQYPTFDQGLHFEDLHEDHKKWQNEVEFFLMELPFFEHLLENYVGNSGFENNPVIIEQFQNKLILHRRQCEILLHDLKEKQKKLNEFIKTHEKNIEFITFSDHRVWRDKIDTQRRLYYEMKQELYHRLPKK